MSGHSALPSEYSGLNPLPLIFRYYASNVAPHDYTTRIGPYTVPALRRFKIEAFQLLTITEAPGDLAVGAGNAGWAASYLFLFDAAGGIGVPGNQVASRIWDTIVQDLCASRTAMGIALAPGKVLQPADILTAQTANFYTATKCTHLISLVGTEYDA